MSHDPLKDALDVQRAVIYTDTVFNYIRRAAGVLSAADPQALIDDIAAEGGWTDLDPKVQADLNRKKALLQAAATFLSEWRRIRDEALAEP